MRIDGTAARRHGGTAAKNPVQAYACNGSVPQEWTVEPDGTIQVYGHCPDVNASDTTIDLHSCTGSGSQQWRTLTSQTLVNPESGKCLGDPAAGQINKTQLQLWTCDGNPSRTGS